MSRKTQTSTNVLLLFLLVTIVMIILVQWLNPPDLRRLDDIKTSRCTRKYTGLGR